MGRYMYVSGIKCNFNCNTTTSQMSVFVDLYPYYEHMGTWGEGYRPVCVCVCVCGGGGGKSIRIVGIKCVA